MKVLYVTPGYPNTYNPIDGIMIQELAHALRELGVDLRVVALYGQVIWPFHKLSRYRFKVAKVDVEEVPWVLRHRIWHLPKGAGITLRARLWGWVVADRVREVWPDFRPDIINAHTFVPGAIVADGLGRRWGCPLVITTHGTDTRVLIKRILQRATILRFCRRAEAVVCVGESIKKCLLQYGVDENNLHVIHNGMDMSKVYEGTNPLADGYQDKFLIVGVGNLKNTKGFDLFIKAMGQLKPLYPNLHGVIVGGGPERRKLQKLIDEMGLAGMVELIGPRPPAEAMAYVDVCDVFCLPSWSEGFGIVYLEAMAHAKPVIAVEDQGIAKIIREHKTGILVPPHDAAAVAEAIKILINEPDTREQMARRGKALIHERFSLEHCASKMIQLYETVLRSN